MKLPPYPLQAVEDQRRRSRDAAQRVLGERLAGLAAAEERLETAREGRRTLAAEHAAAREDLYRPAVGGGLDVGRVHERRRGLDFLARRIERQEAEVERRAGEVGEAEEDVAAARRRLTAAAQELSAIEKHRARWRKEIETEGRRREEKLMDEISTASYARGARG
jgi:flagellar export protein FliJ